MKLKHHYLLYLIDARLRDVTCFEGRVWAGFHGDSLSWVASSLTVPVNSSPDTPERVTVTRWERAVRYKQ